MRFKYLILVLLLSISARAQKDSLIIEVNTGKKDWKVTVGENVEFEIVVKQFNVIANDCTIKYEIGPDMMSTIVKDSIVHGKGYFKSRSYTLKQPGFLRGTFEIVVNGKTYKRLCTVGFDVEKINPTVSLPQDFWNFWEKGKVELSEITMEVRSVYLPDKSSDSVNSYMVSFQNINNSRMYGMLCIPRMPGKYPAILEVPGAGLRPYTPNIKLASRGAIVLTIGIHGIPVNMDSSVYVDLAKGALRTYFYNKANSKDEFYYRRVYLGCLRANDFLVSLPMFDGVNLGVTGGSQGGALSIVTAALDKRVKCLASFYPALSDMTGYLYGRAGGWPHIFHQSNVDYLQIPNMQENLAYYDVVNFAKQLTVPGIYSFGYNDVVCPPTSVYSSINSIKSPKVVKIYKETGHWSYPNQKEEAIAWLLNALKTK
ncbi:MAG: acetylxylan esterase [Pseudopedobacter saltans]|uniref:Acetylxylan esterase n=1 Tax=Pseudopedobacter saltans TaxID=151895 RepID=A0A2W5GVB7_9SPHI|nr:MAG: acetylxylan esterase [Pseudopedobacter saltans]